VLQRRREQRVIAAALPHMASARWIALSEVELLASLPGRRAWRRQAKRQSGKQAAKAVAVYQASVTELAFSIGVNCTVMPIGSVRGSCCAP
jgi:protease PrsW